MPASDIDTGTVTWQLCVLLKHTHTRVLIEAECCCCTGTAVTVRRIKKGIVELTRL
jgi:hypothetical protein